MSLDGLGLQTGDNIPDEYDGSLEEYSSFCSSGLAVCCAFNRRGSLVAVGYNDGRIVIWDFLTRCAAKNIPGHSGHPVSSLSWSRNSRILVSGSLDNSVAIWDVISGDCKIRWIYKSPIMRVQVNPRNQDLVLVCPFKLPFLLLCVDHQAGVIKHTIIDKEDSENSFTSSFDRRGEYIYSGNIRGRLTIVKCPKKVDSNDTALEVISSFRIHPPAVIREICFSPRNKSYFLLNCSDKKVRLFSCDTALAAGLNGSCDELRRFLDGKKDSGWKTVCFSGDAETSYVCGGAAFKNEYHIWDFETTHLIKMIEGNKQNEVLLDLQWHPTKPKLVAISSGRVSVWSRAEIENWSAYAPNFKELEENEEYDERESEFDLEDEDKKPEPVVKETCNEDIGDIDVVCVKTDGAVLSSDEDDIDSLEFIPIPLEDYEMVEIPTQQP